MPYPLPGPPGFRTDQSRDPQTSVLLPPSVRLHTRLGQARGLGRTPSRALVPLLHSTSLNRFLPHCKPSAFCISTLVLKYFQQRVFLTEEVTCLPVTPRISFPSKPNTQGPGLISSPELSKEPAGDSSQLPSEMKPIRPEHFRANWSKTKTQARVPRLTLRGLRCPVPMSGHSAGPWPPQCGAGWHPPCSLSLST